MALISWANWKSAYILDEKGESLLDGLVTEDTSSDTEAKPEEKGAGGKTPSGVTKQVRDRRHRGRTRRGNTSGRAQATVHLVQACNIPAHTRKLLKAR